MSQETISYPYTAKNGSNYIIRFKYTPGMIPAGVTILIPIIEVIIFTEDNVEIIQTSTTLLELVTLIRSNADLVDAVYYSVCSDKMILKSAKRSDLSHQEYRSQLFSSMFNKANADKKYINKPVVITDLNVGNHYIHLMTLEKNQDVIDIISEELKKHDK
ncbi:hypothetical protein [Flavobacterium sp. N1736]|uniref:hypothetical protein n=1 Tax=Flavobacterium sp. N1736 TaxID=2986823 RepID=UPI00222585AC|nr:hypothetical protein [Flavobacterium sp. N1736]